MNMRPSYIQIQQPTLPPTSPVSIQDNLHPPALENSHAFHWDARIRKPLNVPRGNSFGLQTISSSPEFSRLVSAQEFPEPDAQELRNILKIFDKSLTRNPEPSVFDYLVYVALLSRKYKVKRWELWATTGIRNFVQSTDNPLLDISPSKTFVRLLRFATGCHDKQLQREIQGKWITRLHPNDLSPIPAILIADELGNRELLGGSLYAYLLRMEPHVLDSQRIDIGEPLSHQLGVHVFSGYYALQAYWKDLCDNMLDFEQAEGCTAHTDCLTTWKPRWLSAVSRQPPGISPIDILSRLSFVEELLRADPLCRIYMAKQCRDSALGAVLQKRDSLALDMHHIFDL